METNRNPAVVTGLHRSLVTATFLIACSSLLQSQKAFTDITGSSGIDHRFEVFEGMFGGGACVIDFDNDGYEDLYITSGMRDDVLYRNMGDGTFRNVYDGSGLEVTRKYVTQGVAGADVNRDGWVDLFITTINSKDSLHSIPRAINLLFLNKGNGSFQDVTSAYGLDQMYSFSTGVNFGDFNEDGFPDMYVGNYFLNYEGTLKAINDQTIVNASSIAPGYLLINKKGQKFVNRFKDYGLNFRGFGFGAVTTDFNNDGHQDLIVNHDFGYKATPDFLLENEFPKARFINRAKELDMDLKINSMGTAVGDINGDCWMD